MTSFPRSLLAIALLAPTLMLAPNTVGPAQAASTLSGRVTLSATPWTVPTGVEMVYVIASGAAGGDGGGSRGVSGGSGGSGGQVNAPLAVTAGDDVTAVLGSPGQSAASTVAGGSGGTGAGGRNGGRGSIANYDDAQGGGGGGGASAVLMNRGSGATTVIVAGGGGGGGGNNFVAGPPDEYFLGGSGGAGAGGTSSAFGSDGSIGEGSGRGRFGYGATWTDPTTTWTARTANAGGAGGPGADYQGGGGGGAGGGYVGGSGGEAGAGLFASGGGGGGGSSWVDPAARPAGAADALYQLSGSAAATLDYVAFGTTSLSSGIVGSAYSATIDAVFGASTAPTTWSVTPALPSGLSLNTSTGAITGTPTSSSSGTYTVTASYETMFLVSGTIARSSIDLSLTINDASAPSITSVSPTSGPVIGGFSVTIDGTNLTSASSVKFGSLAGTIVTNTATRITATAPSGAGSVAVSVTTAGGVASRSAAVTYNAPTISSIGPTSGSANGGVRVTLNGTNLTYVTGVTFGALAGTSIVVVSDTQVTVDSPATTTSGVVDVGVTASGPASGTKAAAFTYTSVAPQSPISVTASAGIERATVSWTPKLNGGQPVEFTVTSTPGGLTCVTTSSSCDVTGLVGGTAYTFSVVATNATGSSSPSSASSSVTPTAATAPAAPTSVSASASSGAASISWVPPVSNGGRSIIDYTVTSAPGSITCTTATTTCTITGLTNGTPYTFTVKARNSVGSSAASVASAAVTPSAGGGGGGSGGGGSTPPTSSPVQPTATPAPTASQSPAVVGPIQRQPAAVTTFTAPKTIKAPGTTILVRSTLRTTEGTVVRARALIMKVTARNLGPVTKSKAGARIVYGPKGRVSVVNDGKQPIIVTLTLTAPGTSTSLPLRDVHRWSVARAKR